MKLQELKINGEEENPRLPLYQHYDLQVAPQPAYFELDLNDGKVKVDYNSTIGSGVPMRVYNREVLRFKVDCTFSADQYREIFEEIKEDLQEVLDEGECDSETQYDIETKINDAIGCPEFYILSESFLTESIIDSNKLEDLSCLNEPELIDLAEVTERELTDDNYVLIPGFDHSEVKDMILANIELNKED